MMHACLLADGHVCWQSSSVMCVCVCVCVCLTVWDKFLLVFAARRCTQTFVPFTHQGPCVAS